jgi:hypothetical protein
MHLQSLPLHKLSLDYFSKEILPRRGHHFVRLTGKWDSDHLEFASARPYIADLVRALPQLPGLKQLHTPDLVRIVQGRRRRYFRQAEEEKALRRLVQRAEAIMHPEMTPQGLLASFKRVAGTNLRQLEFSSPDNRSNQVGLASILQHFPNLESLKIHFDVFDERGTLNRILDADPEVTPDPTLQPPLRKLALVGAYDHDHFGEGYPENQPSFAAFMRLARQFTDTLQVLAFEIKICSYAIPIADFSPPDHVAEEDKFEFTSPFPVLRRLVIQGGTVAPFLDLLLSLDTRLFPKLDSCLCKFGYNDCGNDLHDALEEAEFRLPVLQVVEPSSKGESLTGCLTKWVRTRASNWPNEARP